MTIYKMNFCKYHSCQSLYNVRLSFRSSVHELEIYEYFSLKLLYFRLTDSRALQVLVTAKSVRPSVRQ
jgi:hypothetical protein